MTLPAPNLDDRRFQELVDEAKRMVQRRCPEWTDHNVSDPGVTLIETFALHGRPADLPGEPGPRTPMYIKFLDLLGVQMFPPTAATQRRSGCRPPSGRRHVPPGTSVATVRTETEEAVSFSQLASWSSLRFRSPGLRPTPATPKSATTPTASHSGWASTPSARTPARAMPCASVFPDLPVLRTAHQVRLRGPWPGYRPTPPSDPVGDLVGDRLAPLRS